MNGPLRPLDALRLLRDERCTETPHQRLATVCILLRTDNRTWEARVSMNTLASDMGASRRCAVDTVATLVAGADGYPIGLAKRTGRKVAGHRREANTYTLFVREGWALSLYLNGASGALVQDVHQPTSAGGAPTIVQEVHQDSAPGAQVLPSDLPLRSTHRRESPPASSSNEEKTRIGDDFVAGPEVRAIADSKGIDFQDEIEKFVLTARRDRLMYSDWQAAAAMWIKRAREPESADERIRNRKRLRKLATDEPVVDMIDRQNRELAEKRWEKSPKQRENEAQQAHLDEVEAEGFTLQSPFDTPKAGDSDPRTAATTEAQLRGMRTARRGGLQHIGAALEDDGVTGVDETLRRLDQQARDRAEGGR